MKVAAVVALILLAGCQPPARTATYFEGHPEDAAQVVAACASGQKHGPECQAAATGQSKARLTLFRKGFR